LKLLLLALLLIPAGLFSETRLRLFSPSFGYARSHFESSNGTNYDLSESSLGGDIFALELRGNRFPWLGAGISMVGRSDNAQLQLVDTAPANGAIAVIKDANYRFGALAPCLLLQIYPLPDYRPLEPFVELRGEVYELSSTSLANPSIDRYRLLVHVGVRGATNETGYYWGARLTIGKRGYSGDFSGVALPDPLLFGIQIDWIGLLL
jgi:hypothetical protein